MQLRSCCMMFREFSYFFPSQLFLVSQRNEGSNGFAAMASFSEHIMILQSARQGQTANKAHWCVRIRIILWGLEKKPEGITVLSKEASVIHWEMALKPCRLQGLQHQSGEKFYTRLYVLSNSIRDLVILFKVNVVLFNLNHLYCMNSHQTKLNSVKIISCLPCQPHRVLINYII